MFSTYILVDDSLFGVPYQFGYPDIGQIKQHAQHLGLSLSSSKAIITARAKELHFLGHTAWFNKVLRLREELLKLRGDQKVLSI